MNKDNFKFDFQIYHIQSKKDIPLPIALKYNIDEITNKTNLSIVG